MERRLCIDRRLSIFRSQCFDLIPERPIIIRCHPVHSISHDKGMPAVIPDFCYIPITACFECLIDFIAFIMNRKIRKLPCFVNDAVCAFHSQHVRLQFLIFLMHESFQFFPAHSPCRSSIYPYARNDSVRSGPKERRCSCCEDYDSANSPRYSFYSKPAHYSTFVPYNISEKDL